MMILFMTGGPLKDLNFRRNESFNQLLECVQKLRGPEGCPWDKEQTHPSLVSFVLDEAYELAEVLQTSPVDDRKLKDELGDLLFQVLIHSQIAHEAGRFDFEGVMNTLREKLIRRHPHVFNYSGPVTKKEVIENWEKIKAAERTLAKNEVSSQTQFGTETSEKKKASVTKNSRAESLDRFFKTPKYFSSLEKAHDLGIKSEELNFDWPSFEEVQKKLIEELKEVEDSIQIGSREAIEEEIGDLLFTAAQISRKLNIDPEKALEKANSKFLKRFLSMIDSLPEKSPDHFQTFKDLPTKEKEDLWVLAKNKTRDT